MTKQTKNMNVGMFVFCHNHSQEMITMGQMRGKFSERLHQVTTWLKRLGSIFADSESCCNVWQTESR